MRVGVLLLALLGTGLAGLAGLLALGRQAAPPGRRLRWLLLCVSGSMAGYILYLLVLPGAWRWPTLAAAMALAGGLATVLAIWTAERRRPAAGSY